MRTRRSLHTLLVDPMCVEHLKRPNEEVVIRMFNSFNRKKLESAI